MKNKLCVDLANDQHALTEYPDITPNIAWNRAKHIFVIYPTWYPYICYISTYSKRIAYRINDHVISQTAFQRSQWFSWHDGSTLFTEVLRKLFPDILSSLLRSELHGQYSYEHPLKLYGSTHGAARGVYYRPIIALALAAWWSCITEL